ncbi:hypothetical protein HOY80DRAFT_998288 [Tuber brumale]|nr:hypothetical protein HOY80DRAFT_998288 [Tuber brumale]
MDLTVPDVVLKDETIEISTANSRQRVQNPLYSYDFTSIDKTEFPESNFNIWHNTVRYPNLTSVNAANKGNAEEVALEMQAAGTFSSNSYSAQNTIGGGRHMSYPVYA